jgi:hypothetical protein
VSLQIKDDQVVMIDYIEDFKDVEQRHKDMYLKYLRQAIKFLGKKDEIRKDKAS